MPSNYDVLSTLQVQVSAALAGVAVGSNKETATLGGAVRAGDVLSLTATGSFAGSPVTVSYTVKAADYLTNAAAGLASAIKNNAALVAAGVSAVPSSASALLSIYYPAVLAIAWTSGVSGGAPETITLANTPAAVQVASGFPRTGTLQEVARGGPPLVSVYDRKIARNTTRWNPFPYNQVTVAPGVTTAVNPPQILHPLGGSGSITLGGTPKAGDAVSCVLGNAGVEPRAVAAVVAQFVTADTPSTFAARLAAAINADPVLGTWVLAVPTGPVIALTNLLAGPVVVESFAGNGGTQQRELGRRGRQFQIMCWARTEVDRNTIVDPIATMIANLQINFLTFPDGVSYGRVLFANDFDLEDNTLEDTYRHDFVLEVDYPVTTTDQLYSMLAPVPAFSTT